MASPPCRFLALKSSSSDALVCPHPVWFLAAGEGGEAGVEDAKRGAPNEVGAFTVRADVAKAGSQRPAVAVPVMPAGRSAARARLARAARVGAARRNIWFEG